jgi:hypothetical protein
VKTTEKQQIDMLNNVSTDYIRDYAYKHGKEIYNFMNKYGVGHSAYGKIMDAAAKGKGVLAHRLYGHHLIYDFPLDSPENIPAFLEHELSDIFTKQGLPILPGELLENTPLLKYCKGLTRNWNFLNGFDILSGTVAIWQGVETAIASFNDELTVDTFDDFAKTFGVGALELAIAVSSANPLLLIAAGLHLTSGIRALLNDGAVIYFRRNINTLFIEFTLDSFNIQNYIKEYSINNTLNEFSVDNALNEFSIDNTLNEFSIDTEIKKWSV